MCPLCHGNHPLLKCVDYATASQNLKDFLGAVFVKLPQLTGSNETWEKIYNNVYTGMGDVESVWEDIFTVSSVGIAHRIYVAATSDRLVYVWGVLKGALQTIPGFKMMKRCRVQDATLRNDTIVIYVGSLVARDAVVDKIRMLLRDSMWNQPVNRSALTLPPRLKPQDFKRDVMPGSGRIADLQGVSVAVDPGPGISFGEKLCKAVAKAYANQEYRQDRLRFVGYALGCLRGDFDIRAPWR